MFTAFHDLLNLLGSALAAFYNLIPNYGIAIILLTVAVRLVLLPLTIKQTRSMQQMQILQPELKRLQAKYKGGDKQKLNEEMMKLYKEHGVNPLGGCLPLVLQLPVFLALYRVLDGCGKTIGKTKVCAPGYVGTKYLPQGSSLYHAIRTFNANFLGMNLGLSPASQLHKGLISALPYFVLVLMMVATTWYQQRQIMAVSTGQQAQQMQMMGKIMPLFLGIFSLELSAGVSIYWVASNVWTIVQQAVMLGKSPATISAPPTARPVVDTKGGAGKPATPPKALDKGKPGAKAGTPGGPKAGTKPTSPDKTPKPATEAGGAGRPRPKTKPQGTGDTGPVEAKATLRAPAEGPGDAKGVDGNAGTANGKPPAKAPSPPNGTPAANGSPPDSNGSGTGEAGAPARPRPQRAQQGGTNARKKRRR